MTATLARGMPGRDTRTRYQGVYARHRQLCPAEADGTGCTCAPSFYGKVYNPATGRYAVTKRFPTVTAAKNARAALVEHASKGTLPQSTQLRVRDAHTRFVAAATEGRVLNKHGRRYKKDAIRDIDSALRTHAIPVLGPKRLAAVTRADVQALVDDLTPAMSGSRVRSVVNALRSLYRWAQDREFVNHDPAALVRLPAMDATPRDRVASPAEFAGLLAALSLEDAVPYALAGYAMGRRAQIQRLRWQDVNLELGAIEWGIDPDARKSHAARRIVPTVKPLTTMLKRAYIAQGRPAGDALVCPPLRYSPSGVLHTGSLTVRAMEAWGWSRKTPKDEWKKARWDALEPIGLHECRHTAGTWLDEAGVSPKVASVLMGHSTPERQAGAAQITLARYTHTLPGALERAREKLDAFIAERTAAEASSAT